MIAGLEDITGGDILIGEHVVNDVPPKDRDIAMVFQNYALYPHMTVYENMSFGLRLKKVRQGRRSRAASRTPRASSTSRELLRAQAQAALRRAAPARRDGPRHRARPEGVPVRRAALEPGRQAARADAHRDQEGAPEGAHHHRLRDARPGRGDDARRPRGGDERGPHRAGRHAERALPRARHQVRRRLHRLAGDELRALRPRGGGGRAARCASADGIAFPGPAGPQPALPARTSASPACCSACGRSTSSSSVRTWSRTSTRFEAVPEVVEPMGMETLVFLPSTAAKSAPR